jgi:3-phosphoshikimate 1-carboxyvinyltransferase
VIRPLRGAIEVVPDKSLTHRGVILGAIAEGRTVLRNPNPGEDCRATLRAVEALGAGVRRESDAWVLEGGRSRIREPEDVLDLGNSGTGIRLLTGFLSAFPFLSVLTGDSSLRGRPMGKTVEPLRTMGARIDAREGVRAPLVVRGGGLHGITLTLAVASAQVKSAVLLAGLGLEEGWVEIREPVRSRDHTERLLRWLGAPLRHEGETIRLEAPSHPAAREWAVPGDISAAVFFLVAAAITPGSRVTVKGVGLNPTRTGALDALERMGARLTIAPSPDAGPEPVGEITAEAGGLSPVTIGGAEVPRLIDEVPVLAVAAACAQGTTRFQDVRQLRYKESDRIRSTCAMLRSFGVEVEEEPDGFAVHGTGRIAGGEVEAQGDHRIAMAACVAGCAAEGEVRVDSMRMVSTSDPGFEERLERLRRGDA